MCVCVCEYSACPFTESKIQKEVGWGLEGRAGQPFGRRERRGRGVGREVREVYLRRPR